MEQQTETKRFIGDDRYTQVHVTDEPDEKSKACHQYKIRPSLNDDGGVGVQNFFTDIQFQKGPIKEAGVNGCHNEDLLVIVLDRLQGFQKSEFSCRENSIAITKIEEALLWLNKRTRDRQTRGVEGTHKK